MAESSPLKSIVSIHDVMPETLESVLSIIDYLGHFNVPPVTLLVVPGRDWTESQLQQLKDLQREGFTLAGHGWVHKVIRRENLYHLLHGLVLSRMAAEHLSLDEREIRALIENCHRWFIEHDFEAPTLYVPPAWAMGVSTAKLAGLPFDQYETQTGVFNVDDKQFIRLTMAGYEADTALRTTFLRMWNFCNEEIARISQTPLRIGIHPFDLDFGLRAQIDEQLRRSDSFLNYQDLLVSERVYS